jgi:long-chain acyl-CoA synthetase
LRPEGRRPVKGRPTGEPASANSRPASGVEIGPADTAEIIFTSGATADPKGVVITHRNILANIVPDRAGDREVPEVRAGRSSPIRFLNLLPLSHMFGQSMATFVPPMLPGVSSSPAATRRGHRPADPRAAVSVLVCVPKMLEVLRDHVIRAFPEAANPVEKMHWTKRWWRYRKIHRAVRLQVLGDSSCGAARSTPTLEAFWGRLGFW